MYVPDVEGFRHSSDVDRGLAELRARAYGPNPDVGVDRAALTRLRELEAVHRADVERRAASPTSQSAAATNVEPAAVEPAAASTPAVKKGSSRSLRQRATATWWSRLAWAFGALVVTGAIVALVFAVAASRPDATLHPTAVEAGDQVRGLVEEENWLEINSSTLRDYGSYLGLEIWSAENAFDSPCLVAVHRASENLSESRCAPPAAELFVDVSSSGDGFEGFEGLAGDGIIRFVLRDDTVDAYVYLMPEAG